MTKLVRQVYLDNAATTRLDPAVLECMLPYMRERYGNPSSTHSLGVTARAGVEDARRIVAEILGVSPGNIFFTSGGTEANNWAIIGMLMVDGMKHVITSLLEHVSVLHPVQALAQQGRIEVSYVPVKDNGELDYNALTSLLQRHPKSLVSLMHGNNEIGNMSDLYVIGALCREYGALFHTDMVQTLGYHAIDLSKLPVDVCSGSAHKLHGPKGVGLIYVRDRALVEPFLRGGMQERGFRAGTENVAGIVGFAKALMIASNGRKYCVDYLERLKKHMIDRLQVVVPAAVYHGLCGDLTKSLCTILSVGLPSLVDRETLLLNLSMGGVLASGSSACVSGGG